MVGYFEQEDLASALSLSKPLAAAFAPAVHTLTLVGSDFTAHLNPVGLFRLLKKLSNLQDLCVQVEEGTSTDDALWTVLLQALADPTVYSRAHHGAARNTLAGSPPA